VSEDTAATSNATTASAPIEYRRRVGMAIYVSGLQSAIAADYRVYFGAQIDLKIANGETDNDYF
jgi:hypothetical protein